MKTNENEYKETLLLSMKQLNTTEIKGTFSRIFFYDITPFNHRLGTN
jgi:hypothetical protein